MLHGLPSNEPMLALAPLGTQEPPACVMWVPHIDVCHPFNMISLKDRALLCGALIKPLLSVPSQKGQHSPGILTGFWQLCLHAIAVQCGSPSTHWQKVQSSSFHCSSWARSLLFTQQLAFVLSIDSSSTSATRWRTMRDEGRDGGCTLCQVGAELIWMEFHSEATMHLAHSVSKSLIRGSQENTKGGV